MCIKLWCHVYLKKNNMPREVCYSDFTMITVLFSSDSLALLVNSLWQVL